MEAFFEVVAVYEYFHIFTCLFTLFQWHTITVIHNQIIKTREKREWVKKM